MNSLRLTHKVIVIACLVVVLLAGTAMASFGPVFQESEKIVALGIALLVASFVAKRLLKP
jgi:hypothetical protein